MDLEKEWPASAGGISCPEEGIKKDES